MTIAFYSVAHHHAFAILPIYRKMKSMGKDVIPFFSQPPKKLSSYTKIVSGTVPEIAAVKKLKNTIYSFHSLSSFHANPVETDYKYIPLFKGVMFPGEWWVSKWKNLPEHWTVIGWPKTDLLKPPVKHERTVLYASSMFDFHRMKTLRLLLRLSDKIGFKLLVKPHHGTAMFFPKQLVVMSKETRIIKSTNDVAKYFHLADILISESSGSLWEFMATGKPSIHMIQGERWGRIYPGGVLKANFDNLEETIQNCFNNPDICKPLQLKWRKKILGPIDGKVCERAIKFIEQVFTD